MYSEALNAIINLGIIKTILIASSWIFWIAAIIVTIIVLFYLVAIYDEGYICKKQEDFKKLKKFLPLMIILFIFAIGNVTIYNFPILKEEIVIAKTIAPILDNYVKENPESVYNPDVVLGEADKLIKGIVNTTTNLPNYIRNLAKGLNIPIQKSINDMTADELREYIKSLE